MYEETYTECAWCDGVREVSELVVYVYEDESEEMVCKECIKDHGIC